MISKIEFCITETMTSFRRHPAMAFAAITCVAAALFVAGLMGLAILNARFAVDSVMDKVRFNVFFHRETTRDEAMKAYQRIEKLPGVASAEFVGKEEGWRRTISNEPDLEKLIGNNPYPDQVVVKAKELHAIPGLIEKLKKWPEVHVVKDVPTVSAKLENISSGISRYGIIIGVILAVLSLVIIHHTIELTLYARRREIFIMSLVGATPTTIAMPFLLEGIVYGLIGAGVALGGLYSLYFYFSAAVWEKYSASLLHSPLLLRDGIVVLAAAGVILGLFGSLVSVLKYLNRPRSKMTNA